jgi:hypothetical protein
MRIRLGGLIAIGILLIWCQALFATDEAPEWTVYKDGRFTLVYAPDTNLKKLEARIRSRYFSVSSAERDLYTNPAYDIEKRITARLELIFLRAEQILAMYPAGPMSIKIKVFRNRRELNEEYFRIFNVDRQYKSFYIHSFGTIYTSMQDVSDSEISHEMSHAIIDSYFAIIPPSKVAELMAVYVDSHLEEE